MAPKRPRNGPPKSSFRYVPREIASPTRRKRLTLPKKVRRFLFPSSGDKNGLHEKTHHWLPVLWLTGVDYFSTLGYQPGIALAVAGAYSPAATVILIFITLFGAVPTYREVARRSYMGQGSIAMLENLLKGWMGKIFILILLGFASTDFVITITLSAADAAAHIVENPNFSSVFGHSQMGITLVFLLALAAVFLAGMAEAISTATIVAVPYILLNIVVLGKCLLIIWDRPELIQAWLAKKELHTVGAGAFDWTAILLTSALIFPKLALGLSGFETGVSVMPLIKDGDQSIADTHTIPVRRIAGTRNLLLTAGLMMSVLLMTSSLSTTILMEPELARKGNEAYGRAISYLAHLYLGESFGTVYDISTIVILWFAGASAMAGLMSLIPRYLPRFGMAPRWSEQRRPLVLIILLVTLIVTIVFHADVEAQAGAYATGVLVLIFSAALAVSLAFWREFKQQHTKSLLTKSIYFWAVTLVFAYTLIENVRERPDGLIISCIFIAAILITGGISRYLRAFELRVNGHKFMDVESEEVFLDISNKKVNLVPLSTPDAYWRDHREAMINNYYRVRKPLAFLTIKMIDDRSEFMGPLLFTVRKIPNSSNFHIEASGSIAVANTIAYVSEQLNPVSIYMGLARKNAMAQAFSYIFFGEGEIGIITYKVLVQHWESTEENDIRPHIYLMSE
jgi:hypothetical protein